VVETLLLPGLDGTGVLFAECARRLAPQLGARVVRYPCDRPLGYRDLERQIEVPAGRFAIVAESFSGPIGVALAARHRERVCALVLVASFVRSPAPVLARLGALLAPLAFRAAPPALAVRHALLGSDAPADQVEALRGLIRSVPAGVLARRLREIAAVDRSSEFAALGLPVLYLAGARDRLVGPAVVAHLRSLRADLEVRVLDAPHLVLQRRPAESAAAISTFLGSSR
jgi:pimeloyl-ACP methyl ester carboxylesterase